MVYPFVRLCFCTLVQRIAQKTAAVKKHGQNLPQQEMAFPLKKKRIRFRIRRRRKAQNPDAPYGEKCGRIEDENGRPMRISADHQPDREKDVQEVISMRKNFGAKPWTYPQPVFILATYGEDGTPDAMNAAWGGISGASTLTMCIGARHKTTDNILARGAFTVSMADAAHVTECDYVGIVSGKEVPDKMARAGFHTVRSEFVDAPVIEELPMTLECRLKSYDPETGSLVAEIVNVSADESVLDAEGNIDPDKLQPITFDPVHNTYRRLGEKAGNAFRDGAKLK